MLVGLVRGLLALAGLHLAAGAAFAVAFHARGLSLLDPAARGAGLGFRLLITPGVVALWPALALKWRRAARGVTAAGSVESPFSPRDLRGAHRILVQVLAVLLPLLVAAALSWRPPDLPPLRLPQPLRAADGSG